jgi:hypothetical protein
MSAANRIIPRGGFGFVDAGGYEIVLRCRVVDKTPPERAHGPSLASARSNGCLLPAAQRAPNRSGCKITKKDDCWQIIGPRFLPCDEGKPINRGPVSACAIAASTPAAVGVPRRLCAYIGRALARWCSRGERPIQAHHHAFCNASFRLPPGTGKVCPIPS